MYPQRQGSMYSQFAYPPNPASTVPQAFPYAPPVLPPPPLSYGYPQTSAPQPGIYPYPSSSQLQPSAFSYQNSSVVYASPSSVTYQPVSRSQSSASTYQAPLQSLPAPHTQRVIWVQPPAPTAAERLIILPPPGVNAPTTNAYVPPPQPPPPPGFLSSDLPITWIAHKPYELICFCGAYEVSCIPGYDPDMLWPNLDRMWPLGSFAGERRYRCPGSSFKPCQHPSDAMLYICYSCWRCQCRWVIPNPMSRPDVKRLGQALSDAWERWTTYSPWLWNKGLYGNGMDGRIVVCLPSYYGGWSGNLPHAR